MRSRLKTASIWIIGVLLVLVGIGAGFVPLVPGVVLIFIGLYIISFRSLWLRSKIEAICARHPKFGVVISKFEIMNAFLIQKNKKLFAKIKLIKYIKRKP